MTPHNLGKFCKDCKNHHMVNGDDACNVTGKRITPTMWKIIYEVGCASFNNGHESHTPIKIPRITYTRFERDGLHYSIDDGVEDIIRLKEHDLEVRDRTIGEVLSGAHLIWQSPQSYGQRNVVDVEYIESIRSKINKEIIP